MKYIKEKKMIKIGYQGIEGSNAEQAAHELVEKLKLHRRRIRTSRRLAARYNGYEKG